jgi:hypothetical protein
MKILKSPNSFHEKAALVRHKERGEVRAAGDIFGNRVL